MNKILQKIFAVIIAASLTIAHSATVQRYAPPDSTGALCKPTGVMVGFFNGVNTVYEDARLATNTLKAQYGTITPSGEKMVYETFFNHSDSLPIDIIETMNLRLGEIDARLSNRYDLIFKTITGDLSWATSLGAVNAALQDELKTKFGGALPTLIAGFSRLLGNPASTSKDLASNQDLLEKYKTE